VAAARLDQPGMRLADREFVRRRRREIGLRRRREIGLRRRREIGLRLVLERRVPGRPAGGQTRREVGYVAHISEA
jgi:hypothetical protein